jgi:putative membrane protein insertion efficiency factor
LSQKEKKGTGQAARLVIGTIGLYQRFVSPMLGSRCRYVPTCSRYASDSIAAHGLRRGSWLAVRRLGRCHPFRDGGHDPVPRSLVTPAPPTGRGSAS